MAERPESPMEVAVGPFRSVLRKTRPFRNWQPPTWLGISLTMNVVLFSYIVYPPGGFSALTPQYPSWYDLKYAFWFLQFFCIYRMIFNYHFAQPLAFALGATDNKNQRKFSQQFMNMQLHLVSTIWLWLYLRAEPWYHDIELLFVGFPNRMEPHFLILFMLHIGYHTNSLLFHFTDELRADFVAMLLHHVLTVFILIEGHMSNCHRYGALVLFINDIADVITALTKIMNYTMHQKIAVGLLPILTASWIYTRCYLFPFWVIPSLWSKTTIEAIPTYHRYSGFVVFAILVVLNYMWLFMLLRTVYNALIKKKVIDFTEQKVPKENAVSGEGRHRYS